MSNLTWLYVGALYAVCVAALRRVGFSLPRRVAILFYLAVLAFLWQPLTQRVSLIAGDVVKLTQPWSEVRAPNRPPVTKYEVSNLNLQDVTMQIAPWTHQVRDSWRALEVPLWNAANGAGYPLHANGQSTPFAPFRLLTLPLPFAYAYAAESAMKLLAAILLTYLFCRRRLSTTASVFGALAYGLSTWMTVWMQFPIAGAAAFLPGVFLTIDLLLERVTYARFTAACLMFATTVLSGHPETIAQVGMFAAAYGVWVGLVEGRAGEWGRRPAARPHIHILAVAAACLVAALITSPILLPFAEAALRSERLAEVRETPEMTESPLPPFDSAVLLLNPRFFGELPLERPWGLTVNESICGFSGALAIAAALAAPIIIVRERLWRQRETLYVLGLVLSLGVILNWRGVTAAFHALAGLAPTGRMRIGVCWFAALLLASVIDWTRTRARMPILLAILAVAVTMLVLVHRVDFPSVAHRDAAVLALMPSIALLAAGAVLRSSNAFSALFVVVLMVVDLWLPVARWNPALPLRELYPETPLIAELKRIRESGAAPFRIAGTAGQLYPNTGAMAGFDDVRVHDPMASRRYLLFLQSAIGWEPRNYYEKWNDAETRVLDFLNAKYVVTEPGRRLAAPRYVEKYSGRDGHIYENREVLPLFFAVRNVVADIDPRTHVDWRFTASVSRIPVRHRAELTAPWIGRDAQVAIERVAAAEYRLQIDAPRTALIVSSIENYPGWRAGNFPTVEVNGLFFGFVVPAGRHSVTVEYRPASFYATAPVALLTLAALLAGGWRRRHTSSPASVSTDSASPPQNEAGT